MNMFDSNIMSTGNLLDVDLINDHLLGEGMTIRWYPARRCSCWGKISGVPSSSGAPDPSCTICSGAGTTYPSYQNVTVLLDGMENIANWLADSGVTYVGAIRMFVPSVVNGQSVDLYTQGTLNDLIYAEDITLTTRTMVQRGVDELREGVVGHVGITYGPTDYTEDVDYRVSGKNVTWLSGGPPLGDFYECTYSFHPWFSITQGMAIAKNLAHLNLPRQFTLQFTPDLGDAFPNGY